MKEPKNLWTFDPFGWEKTNLKILQKVWQDQDKKKMEYYLQFGDDTRRILLNEYNYTNGLKFGFKSIILDDYRWLERRIFEKHDSQGWDETNEVTVYRSPNNRYCHGIYLTGKISGTCNGPSVFSKPFDDPRECMLEGLDKAIEYHTRHISNKSHGRDHKKSADQFLEIKKNLVVSHQQLSLFG